MKQSRPVGILIAVLLLAAPMIAAAESAIVVPMDLDFEQVEVGDAVVLPLTITSGDPYSPLSIYSIQITDDPSGSFEITSISPDPIPPELFEGEQVIVEVTYTPGDVGVHAGIMTIHSNDHEEEFIEVSLQGEGIDPGGEPTPRELMDELLEYFEAMVSTGELEGTGWCPRMRRARVETVRIYLQLASMMIDWGFDEAACGFLHFVDLVSDGEGRPRDFLTGSATDDFNELVGGVMDALGCGEGCSP